jgi:hypothetical protein
METASKSSSEINRSQRRDSTRNPANDLIRCCVGDVDRAIRFISAARLRIDDLFPSRLCGDDDSPRGALTIFTKGGVH